MVHPEDRERVEEVVRAALKQVAPFQFEHRAIRPDGEERVLDCRGRMLRDAAGKPAKLLGTVQDVTALRSAEERLEHLALHDPLTGLPNRTLFLDRLEHALAASQRPDSSLAVLFCDIDDFKNVNDGLGHEAGDELLVALPPRLREALRPADTLARFGGDEFAILCEGLGNEADAVGLAERITTSVAQPLEAGGRVHDVGVSIGVVFVAGGRARPGEILRDADAAMYRAKAAGKRRFALFDHGMRARAVKRLQTEGELRKAIAGNQLQLLYQPVVAVWDRKLAGVEALLRWQHPRLGILPPSEFIGVAEESGLIVELGAWVLNEACARAAAWNREDGQQVRMGINLSARQVTDTDVAALLAETLERTALDPGMVVIEITESVLLERSETSLRNLERLRELGASLVLDDFGTGYSSLSYLKRMPIDRLKVDRDFVGGLGEREDDTAIVAAILSMADSLGIGVIAEGVETEAQLRWLREHGCRYAQGFLLSPPLPPERLEAVIGAGRL